jgi:hypothetical protein
MSDPQIPPWRMGGGISQPVLYQGPGGGRNPVPGAGQHAAGGGAKLPLEGQQRRQPHPEAGSSVAAAIAARSNRRKSMILLRLVMIVPARRGEPAERTTLRRTRARATSDLSERSRIPQVREHL